jgi:hypothetical protein
MVVVSKTKTLSLLILNVHIPACLYYPIAYYQLRILILWITIHFLYFVCRKQTHAILCPPLCLNVLSIRQYVHEFFSLTTSSLYSTFVHEIVIQWVHSDNLFLIVTLSDLEAWWFHTLLQELKRSFSSLATW